jgi:hypothetical protein
MSVIQQPPTKTPSRATLEPVLVLIDRKSLTPWGIRTETTYANALGGPESYVQYAALKPVGAMRTFLINAMARFFTNHELLIRLLLSTVVSSDDAKYALGVVDSYGVTVPSRDIAEDNGVPSEA